MPNQTTRFLCLSFLLALATSLAFAGNTFAQAKRSVDPENYDCWKAYGYFYSVAGNEDKIEVTAAYETQEEAMLAVYNLSGGEWALYGFYFVEAPCPQPVTPNKKQSTGSKKATGSKRAADPGSRHSGLLAQGKWKIGLVGEPKYPYQVKRTFPANHKVTSNSFVQLQSLYDKALTKVTNVGRTVGRGRALKNLTEQ